MRIAFVVWRFPVLSEPFILNQIAGLLERGHDVQIHAINGRPDYEAKKHDLVDRYGMEARTHLTPPRPEGWAAIPALVRAMAGPALRRPRAFAKLLVRALRQRQGSSMKMLFRAAALLEAGDYDVVHCQFGSLALPVLEFRKAGLLGGRLVTHFRGIDISSYVKDNGADVYDEVFEKSDLFLANCDFFRQKAIALGCPEGKIVTLGSGIDLPRFPFRPIPALAEGEAHLISAGRLVEKKGFVHMIDALAQLRAAGRRVRYSIIGDGPERGALEARIAEHGLEDQVSLLGWRTHQEISDLLSAAHLFAAPCQTAADGNQDAPVNTLKEAMAIGMPVLATRHGGIPELVEDGVSGFLTPEKDAGALAAALGRLLDAPERWPAMAAAGRAAVERLYDAERLNDELVTLYQGLIAELEDPIIGARQQPQTPRAVAAAV